MTDPEQALDHLPPADLEEVVVDEADEFERPVPLEAEPADVVEHRRAVDEDPEDYRQEYEF